MKFTLVYQGQLSASGNKSKTKEVFKIREAISPQLKTLWETSRALNVLQNVGWAPNPNGPQIGLAVDESGILSPRKANEFYPGAYVPLFGELPVGQSQYVPLVRKSLHLACDLSVLFLRQEDPGNLITQAGDIDGRIKTLLDALRMPTMDEQHAAGVDGVTLHVLMESDALVTGLKVNTERLLFPKTEFVNEVHLVIEVGIRVLQVVPENTCLL